MPRLAWFTPLPPARSGIAAYSAELLPLLAPHFDIEVFVDRPAAGGTAAHDFVWKTLGHAYDLVVYQLGNAPYHDYMWPYLARYPGLVVLHDGRLHHSRAKALLTRGRASEYADEFRFNHPNAPEGIADLAALALLGDPLFYFWPMIGTVVRSARLVAVHSARLADELREEFPAAAIETIRMGVADPINSPSCGQGPGAVGPIDVRARHDIPEDAVVFAAFGLVTPEKRISQALRALAAVVPYAPDAVLMLVGDTVDYYDVRAEAAALGVEGRVRITGYVANEDLPAYLDAADVCLCLRWPTARETSASWLRCLAAGKPTIVTDLTHTDDVAALDPRTWTTREAARRTGAAGEEDRDAGAAVSVAIDILDEDHSLALAMRRLAVDGTLREDLGRRARAHWQTSHTLEIMAADYQRVIELALERPSRRATDLPAHLLADGTALARKLIGEVGATADMFAPD